MGIGIGIGIGIEDGHNVSLKTPLRCM